MTADFFAMVRLDELWIRGALSETRISQGQAMRRGNEIVACDTIRDPALRTNLRDRCQAEMDHVHRAIASMRDARVRCVATAFPHHPEVESTITIRIEGISVVTTLDAAAADYDALKTLLATRPAMPLTRRFAPPSPRFAGRGFSQCRAPSPRLRGEGWGEGLPIVWRNGSAAVLLHEAIGHAAEHGHAPIAWPRWLRARDTTRDGRSADLIAGEQPLEYRRESFRDIPMRRMTSLLIEQKGAPFALPLERIEVHLAAGGAYEPLTEMVTVDVAVAGIVTGDGVQRASRFAVRASRSAIAGALVGATGDPIRYPGVICSREGQELFVASHAPVMVTAELA